MVGSVVGDYKCKQRHICRIATWNVRSMKKVGSLENLKLKMDRLAVDILQITVIRWPNSRDLGSGNFRIL